MLQRIQTLFLLLALAATSLTFIFPIASIASTDGKVNAQYTSYGLKNIDAAGKATLVNPGFIYWIGGAVLLFLLFAITQYKKRQLQMRICRLSYVLILTQFALCFFMPDSSASSIKYAGEVKVTGYGLAFYLPIIALVLTFLAERFIKKDEDLVRSVDRLR